MGIPPEQLETIFLPFEQVGDTKHRVAGTGLGLAITRQLVRLMGSAIHVKSDVGQGSVFWFDLELPETERPVETREATPHTIIGFHGEQRKILLVDDQPENLAVFQDMLMPLGFETRTAAAGEEAIETAVQFLPNLVLMDLIMPGMDGFEAIRRLRQIPELHDVLVLATSANVFGQTRQKSQAAGSDGFLAKPIHEDELLALLAQHLHLKWIYQGKSELQDTAEKGRNRVQTELPQKESTAEKKSTVLIVDDQPINIQVLANIIKETYAIQAATNGVKALEIASGKNPPDVILLDIIMPEMDGYEVCRRLKADKQTRDIPVIFVTTKDSAEDVEYGFSLGAVDYISRPFLPTVIQVRVKNQMQ